MSSIALKHIKVIENCYYSKFIAMQHVMHFNVGAKDILSRLILFHNFVSHGGINCLSVEVTNAKYIFSS